MWMLEDFKKFGGFEINRLFGSKNLIGFLDHVPCSTESPARPSPLVVLRCDSNFHQVPEVI